MFIDLKSASNRVGKTLDTLYTVPTAKKSLVYSIQATNLASAAILASVYKTSGGGDQIISNSIPVASGSTVNVVANKVNLLAGESIKVVASEDVIKIPTTQAIRCSDGQEFTLGRLKVANNIAFLLGSNTSGNPIIFQRDGTGTVWNQLTTTGLPTTASLIDIDYNSGTYAMIASNVGDKVFTSTNLTTWTQNTTGLSVTTPKAIKTLSSICVMTSGSGIHTATSPSGTWVTRYNTNSGGQLEYCSGMSLWVSTTNATSGNILTSSDAISWTLRSTGQVVNLDSIVYDSVNNRLWTFRVGNVPYYSADGINYNSGSIYTSLTDIQSATVFCNSRVIVMNGTTSPSGYYMTDISGTVFSKTPTNNSLEGSNTFVSLDYVNTQFANLNNTLIAIRANLVGELSNFTPSAYRKNALAFTAAISEVTL